MKEKEKRVHDEIRENLESVGWYSLPDFQEGKVIEDYVRWNILLRRVEELNRDKFDNFSPRQKEYALNCIKNRLDEYDFRKVLNALKNGVRCEIDMGRGRVSYTFRLIDYENPERNEFHYAHEAQFPGNPRDSRPDFTLFVNGIPLVIIEAKQTDGDTLSEARSQIELYEMRSPRLFKFVQAGVMYASEKRYMPTWPNPRREERLNRRAEIWREKTDDGYSEDENIIDFLKPQNLLRIIEHYTYIRDDGMGNIARIMPRYVQFYASEEVFSRIENYIKGGEKNRGLVWHWQGTGKSLIIIYLAYRFLRQFRKEHPHVFIVVDRKELEEQFDKDYLRRITPPVPHRKIGSIKELREEIEKIREQEENPALTHSTLNLVLLHKFREDELRKFLEEHGPIGKREILILRDEVHRTEHGKLADMLHEIFPNAIKVSFTGTPIARKEKNTFELYAYPKEGELYLDRFFIEQSLRDGFTLSLVWREVTEEDFVIPGEEEIKELVSRYIAEEEMEGERVSIKLEDILASPGRIEAASQYIAERIEEDTEGFKFKAFVVAHNRYAALLFYRYLKDYLKDLPEKYGWKGDDWIQVVMTESGKLKNARWQYEIEEFIKGEEKKHMKAWEQIISDAKERFTNPDENPRILVVSDMLLQGYDAPVLKVMYIYKIMRGHLLLQATARTNRPFPSRDKETGLIVDMTGLLVNRFEEAIREYNMYASPEIQRDILTNLFRSQEEKWEEFIKSFEDVKNHINQILGPMKWNYEKLKERWYSMAEGKGSENLPGIIGLLTSHHTVMELIDSIKRTIVLFESIGSYPGKIDYYDDIEFLKSLRSNLRVALFGRRRASRDRLEMVRDKVLEELKFEKFVERGETLFDENVLMSLMPDADEISREKARIAGLINLSINRLEEGRGPLYRELRRQLEELRKRLLTEQNLNLITLKEIAREVESLEKRRREYESRKDLTISRQIAIAACDARYRDNKKLGDMIEDNKSREEVVEQLEDFINRILKRGKLLDSDRGELEKMIVLMLKDDALDEMDEIVEYILENVKEALYERRIASEENSP